MKRSDERKLDAIREGLRGLHRKYIITKADGSPVDPEADYFVLRLDTDPTARHAARTYARNIEGRNPQLAEDIRDSCDRHAFADPATKVKDWEWKR